ncbi:MAG: hypothetical protein O7G30_16920 [Proteobacteria bacterium]|nr:hypothetical protein [Pseudomonadota bacterium]
MKHRIGWALALSLAVAGWITAPTAALADHHEGPAVSQVIVVDVAPQNMEAYMGYVKRAQGIAKDLGLPPFQVLRATFSGDSTGTVAIIIEAESLAALAANQAKTAGSEQWKKMVSDIQKAGISRVTSRSIWEDVTP